MDQQNESDLFGSVLKIALGIFFGTLLVWMVGAWVVGHQMRQVSGVVQQSFAEMNARAQAQQRQREAQALAKRRAEQRRIEAQVAVEAAARAEARRKDQAWARFFQRSEECLRTSSVECGNQYIRARREFERRYAAGELN